MAWRACQTGPVTQPQPPEPVQRGQFALTFTLLSGALAIAFEAYAVLTAMPAAAEDLGRLDLYAWAFTAFVIAQVFSIVVGGRLVDRIGPVLPLGTGLGVFIVGLLAAGLAPSMELLLAARVVQGLGAGATNVAFMVVVAQAYDKQKRAWLMSLLSLCWMLPSFLGPPLAAGITTRFGWQWVFLGVIPFLAFTFLPGARPLLALHRNRVPTPAPSNPVPVWAAFAAAVGAALLQLAGQRLDISGLAIGAVGLVVLLVGLPRLMPTGFGRVQRGLPSVMWTRGLACGAFFAAESFLPLTLIRMHGFELGSAGLFIAIGSTGWTVGSLVQASRWLRIRRDQIIHLGAASLLVGLVTMATAVVLTAHWGWLAVALVVAGLGMGLLVSSTSLVNMQVSEPRLIGRNTSSLQVAEGIGNGLVTGLAGAFFAALHMVEDPAQVFTPVYAISVVVMVLGLLVSLRIGPVRNESAGVG